MSHTTKISSVPIRSVTALERAVEQLQKDGVRCSFIKNSYPRMFYSSQVADLKKESSVCHTLRLDNSNYDVGFVQQKDGTYSAVFDDWAGQVKSQVGAACGCKGTTENEKHLSSIGRVMQYYTAFASIESMEEQGWTNYSWEMDKETGKIELLIDEPTY